MLGHICGLHHAGCVLPALFADVLVFSQDFFFLERVPSLVDASVQWRIAGRICGLDGDWSLTPFQNRTVRLLPDLLTWKCVGPVLTQKGVSEGTTA